jgi:hypothetical protein
MADVKDYSADALLRAEKQVELDTDDVKEENVEIKEEEKKEEKEKPNLNVGEVDLGYTDHSKEPKEEKEKVAVEEVVEEEKPVEEKKVESKTEEKKDNLNQYTESVQKRIDKLVRKRHEAERREKAALDFAKGLQKKYDTTIKKFNSTDESYLKELDARVDAQREQTKNVLRDAIEKNDVDKIMEANDTLTKLAVEKEKARLEIAHRADIKKEEEENKKTQQQQQNVEGKPQEGVLSREEQPNITPKAKKWAEDNKWFGEDEVMTNAAITIHNNLANEGLEVDSDEYYNEVNARLRKYFPASFASDDAEQKKEQKKPVQTVASAGRKQQGRRTVKLTRSQVAIAKRLGVPLEEYARYVKEDN